MNDIPDEKTIRYNNNVSGDRFAFYFWIPVIIISCTLVMIFIDGEEWFFYLGIVYTICIAGILMRWTKSNLALSKKKIELYRNLERYGVRTKGTITEKRLISDKESTHYNHSSIDYEFVGPSGIIKNANIATVPKRKAKKYQISDKIIVYYDCRDPTVSISELG